MSNEKIEMTPVKSSNIAAVGYKDGKMQVQFHGGGLYSYNNVPVEVFEGMKNAESVGGYFHRKVKGVYPFTKIK